VSLSEGRRKRDNANDSLNLQKRGAPEGKNSRLRKRKQLNLSFWGDCVPEKRRKAEGFPEEKAHSYESNCSALPGGGGKKKGAIGEKKRPAISHSGMHTEWEGGEQKSTTSHSILFFQMVYFLMVKRKEGNWEKERGARK